MNKTVNINLAGIFFHIDEDAYLKLQRYLDAIKRSFTNSDGQAEIIADIEARIAELFMERVKHDKQVIGTYEVDAVIIIMGQPEDYLVDDEIFEDEPKTYKKTKSASPKKLFRDKDNSYISGVASGLGHYLGIDSIWMRLIWLLLAFGSGGTFIIIYILFWVLVPEAKTTAEKIMMTGEPVNISNIEKKIKDGFENVTDAAKNVSDTLSEKAKHVSESVSNAAKNIDFTKPSNSLKSSSKTFFDTLGEVIMFFMKIFAKFIGIILILVGAVALISLIIGVFSINVTNIISIPGLDLVDIANVGNTPVWLASLFVFFTIGIPFFFLFYLGLKILINNLKSIGNIAKFTLLGVWLISIIGLIIIGIRQASEHAFDQRVIDKKVLNITPKDTLNIKMVGNDLFQRRIFRNNNGFKILHNDKGEKTIYSADIVILVKSTKDSVASIGIDKSAEGSNYEKAIERAKDINYNYVLKNKTLWLDAYLTTRAKNKFSDQEVVLTLYLPEGTIVKCHDNSKTFFYYNNDNGTIITFNDANHYLKITEDGIECLDCPIEEEFEVEVNTPKVKIDENGIEIKSDKNHLKIDKNGIKAESDAVKINIDSKGIKIKSED